MSVGLTAIPNLDAQLADLKERGLDPAVANICAPSAGTPGAIKGVAGCRHFQRCIFGRKENGAGKGKGKHNIPYFIDARDGLNHATERITDCMLFMQLLNPRRVAGLQATDEGLDGEVIEIMCENGKLAESYVETGFVRIDPSPNGLEKGYHRVDVEKDVPKYKFPQEMEHKAVSKVRDRRAARLARDPESLTYVEAEVEVLDLGSSEPKKGKRGPDAG